MSGEITIDPAPQSYIFTDLSYIPRGQEQDIQNDLNHLQRILNFYINTSALDLSSQELADSYKKLIDNISFARSGSIAKSSDGFAPGDPRKYYDDHNVYDFLSPSLRFDSRIGSRSGLPAEDHLVIALDKDGKPTTTTIDLINPHPEIMSLDDVRRYMRMFKVSDGWIEEIEYNSNSYDLNGRRINSGLGIIKRYADGGYVEIVGHTDGIFSFRITAGSDPNRPYIAH